MQNMTVFPTPPPPPFIFSDVFLALFNRSFLDSEWDRVLIVSIVDCNATPTLANTGQYCVNKS